MRHLIHKKMSRYYLNNVRFHLMELETCKNYEIFDILFVNLEVKQMTYII